MNKERPYLVNTKIAKYLEDQDIRRAYTVLYRHLLDAKEDGTTYYSQAEINFDRDPKLGPNKRMVANQKTDALIENERVKLEDYIDGKSENAIARKTENINSLLLLMILDLILKDWVDNSPVPLTECYKVADQSFYLLTHQYATNKDIKASHQSGDLKLIVRWNHVVQPKFNNHLIHVENIDSELYQDLKREINGSAPSLNIYSAEEHRVPYDWSVCKTSKRFQFNGYKLEDTPKNIIKSLQHASSLNIPIVIFPELTINQAVREDIKVWLATEEHKLLLIIAGSWHVNVSTDSTDPMNESLIFDKMGHTILTHRKTTTFSFKQDQNTTYHEGILNSNRINLAMLPFGLITLLICKDFCDLLSSVQDALKYCSPDFIFLPTMGDGNTLNAHDNAYNNLNVSFMPTLICSNQTPNETPGTDIFWGRVYCGIHAVELPDGSIVSRNSEPTTDLSTSTNNLHKDLPAADVKHRAPFAILPKDKLYRLKLRT